MRDMIVLIGALMTIITTLSLPRRCKWTLVERVPAHRITISVFYTFRKVTTHAKRQFRVECSFPTVVETPPVSWSFFFVGLKSFFISSRTTRHFTWQKKSAWIERSAEMKLYSLLRSYKLAYNSDEGTQSKKAPLIAQLKLLSSHLVDSFFVDFKLPLFELSRLSLVFVQKPSHRGLDILLCHIMHSYTLWNRSDEER